MKVFERLCDLFIPFVFLIAYAFKYGEDNQPLFFGVFAIVLFIVVIYNKICQLIEKITII